MSGERGSLRAAGGAPCELRIRRDQMPAFQTMPSLVPETRASYRAAAAFVAAHLPLANQKAIAS
ncbi:hypothetical protein [Nocardia sp. NPDC050717]|uniref:hypothetical protein n=1 Tax=Nocardia sp. NPDC050717 TaxID=3157221 RepID=UPI0033EADF4E